MSRNVNDLKAEFLEDLELAQGRSVRTVENYDRYLTRFFAETAVQVVGDISLDGLRKFRKVMVERRQVAPPTLNYHLIALRQFLSYLAKRDVPALPAEKVGLAKLAEREIDVLYPEELDALLGSAKSEALNPKSEQRLSALRDHAILQTLFSTGMRISEATRLDRDSIPRGGNEVPVRGKGNKVRVTFLSDEAREAITTYLAARGDMDPALFIRHKKGSVGATDDLRLSVRSVQRLIKKYAVAAGLTKKITPHTLRHSFATDLLSNGADVRQVQQLLGHASITTTQVYTHLTDSHLREVHEKFHRKPSNR